MVLSANPDGWIGWYMPKKQRGEAQRRNFLVPRRVSAGGMDFFHIVNHYMVMTRDHVPELDDNSPLFLQVGPVGDRFINTRFGYNSMRKVSSKIAKRLGLPNPELYTGHCLRR